MARRTPPPITLHDDPQSHALGQIFRACMRHAIRNRGSALQLPCLEGVKFQLYKRRLRQSTPLGWRVTMDTPNSNFLMREVYAEHHQIRAEALEWKAHVSTRFSPSFALVLRSCEPREFSDWLLLAKLALE